MREYLKRFICMTLTCILFLTSVIAVAGYSSMEVRAAQTGTFTLAQAKKLALANSRSYKKVKAQILIKETKYTNAVKSLNLKKKNKETFRWSPLLNFKLPEKLDAVEEFDYLYKPLEYQSEINSLQHELNDTIYEIYEEITNLYISAYTLQETIAFNKERMSQLQETLARNQARLAIGEAKQSDVDAIEKSIKTLTNTIAADSRSLEAKKSDIKDMTKLDITTGYKFTNPYIDSTLSRDHLKEIENHTLENDQSYYESKLTCQLALTALNTNYSILQKNSQYSKHLNMIDSYINTVRNGGEIEDEAAFKQAYDKMLTAVDYPWKKLYTIRLLFLKISFNMEFLMGENDGTRYIEDDPNALYTNVLEYQNARSEQESAKKALIKQVDQDFENLVTTKNAYFNLVDEAADKKREVEKAQVLNSLGELEYEELKTTQDEYESVQQDMMDALDLYSQTLTSYDRLTCGAVSKYIKGGSTSMETAVGGDSYLTPQEYEGATYYIKTQIEDSVFELGIHIPDDFSLTITDYELWCDGEQIGERTSVDQVIRHLALSKEGIDKAFIRLYNDDQFVDDCEIDPQEYSGELIITGGYELVEPEVEELAGYSLRLNEDTGLATLKLTPTPDLGIARYALESETGKRLNGDSLTDIKDSFTYLSILAQDPESVTVLFYDSNDNLLYKGYFDTANYVIRKEVE